MSFTVLPFSRDSLYSSLANRFATAEYIAARSSDFLQAAYLAGYLERLGAKTILVENDYIDRDYLTDFASYYVTCFEKYDSRCKRLHFFSSTFDTASFERWIRRRSDSDDLALQKAYLGFIVARPLPQTIVGRTALKTYEPDGAIDRRYRTLRTYEVNLFGLPLRVDSLAYQQQDTVVAACATVALWSAFHKTSELFHHPLLRPSEITADANTVQGGTRAMPSSGLRVEQVCAAIRRAGLEPLAQSVQKQTLLMSTIHGYLEYGIPVILLGRVEEFSYSGHAITVTGYALGAVSAPIGEQTLANVTSIGRRIQKLYVHDDNIGPFARSVPVAVPVNAPDYVSDYAPFALQAQDANGVAQATFVPSVFVVPVYPKIRITYSEAHVWAGHLRQMFGFAGVDADGFEWSIGLTSTQRYKTLLRNRAAASVEDATRLTEGQPRFMWHGLVKRGPVFICEFLIDATGVSRSCPLLSLVWHDTPTEVIFKSGVSKFSKVAIERIYSKLFADVVYQ